MIGVTDHALIRWLERVHGIDMEFYRRTLDAIVADAVKAKVSQICIEGCWYVFAPDGTLITVTETKPHARSKPKHDRGNVNGSKPKNFHDDHSGTWQAKSRRRRWR